MFYWGRDLLPPIRQTGDWTYSLDIWIESETFWWTGWGSNHLSHPTRALFFLHFLVPLVFFLPPLWRLSYTFFLHYTPNSFPSLLQPPHFSCSQISLTVSLRLNMIQKQYSSPALPTSGPPEPRRNVNRETWKSLIWVKISEKKSIQLGVTLRGKNWGKICIIEICFISCVRMESVILYFIFHTWISYLWIKEGWKKKKKGKIQKWLIEKQQEMGRKSRGEEENHSLGKKSTS